jgi:hypothetical protein
MVDQVIESIIKAAEADTEMCAEEDDIPLNYMPSDMEEALRVTASVQQTQAPGGQERNILKDPLYELKELEKGITGNEEDGEEGV